MKKKIVLLAIGAMFLFVAPITVVHACDDFHTCSSPLKETQKIDCQEGYSGFIAETRTKTSYPGCDWGEWFETANTCKINTYTVSASSNAGGIVTPVTQTVNYDGTATVTVTPDDGYTASVSGTCGGTLNGGTYTTEKVKNNCTVEVTFSQNPVEKFTVTASSNTGGTVSPTTQEVEVGSTAIVTVTPEDGYTASVSGTCGGTLVGNTFTTASVTNNCTVIATFTQNPVEKFTVTASSNAGGTVSPATQEVNLGSSAIVTVNPDALYTASVSGTCGGTLVGNTYTTASVIADCSVVVTFSQNPVEKFTVLATSNTGGTVDPASQEVNLGSSAIVTVNPDALYTASVSGTCGGTLVGNTFTTASVTKDCTVEVTFTKNPVNPTKYTLTVVLAGTGTGSVSTIPVGITCGTDCSESYDENTIVTLNAVSSDSTIAWNEACSAGVIAMDADKTCTATFTLKEGPIVGEILGCTDSSATNFQVGATKDDGSCTYSHSHHSSGSTPQKVGQVLGESTTCGIYVDKFVRMGLKDNDQEAVKKIQIFLNGYMGSNLVVDGIFGSKTDAAVRAFQRKHADKVLDPWGLRSTTGIFYLTTQTEVNNIMCPALNLPIPVLVPMDQNPSFPKF